MAPWCNPLTLRPEQSGGVGLNPGRAPPLERHDKGSHLCCFYLSDEGKVVAYNPSLGITNMHADYTITYGIVCSTPLAVV